MFFKNSSSAQLKTLPLFTPQHLQRGRRTYNEAIFRALCHSAYLGDDTALCRVLGRYKMFVDTQDVGISVHLMLDGYWEMWLTEALAATLRPGMLAIDVGANLGYYSVLMADMIGPQGRVHAFEPNRALSQRLRRTALANGFDRSMTIHETALGDQEGGVFRFIVPNGDPKNGYMQADPGMAADDPNAVVTRRLDSYAELLDADVIKIDADTAEWPIWRGMRGIFDRGRPLTIFLEFNNYRYDDPAAFLGEILQEGFRLARIDLAKGIEACSPADILGYEPVEDQILMMTR